MTTKTSRSLTIGVSQTSLNQLTSAAALKGVSVEKFVVDAAEADARRASMPTEVIDLSDRDYHRVLELIEQPPTLTPAFTHLMADYQALKTDGSNSSFKWTPR